MNPTTPPRPRGLARVGALLALLALPQACMTPDVEFVEDPDPALTDALRPMVRTRDDDGQRRRDSVVEERRELQRLALRHPRHAPTLTAAAALAVEDGDRIQAQYLLDQASAVDPAFLPAALLRVRIAAEEGSLRLAKRRLEELLAVQPDEPRLHDALAGVHYLESSYEAAREEVLLAQRLAGDDAEPGHFEYHLGLIAEALGDEDTALEHYRESLDADPDRAGAAARVRWLEARQQSKAPVEESAETP